MRLSLVLTCLLSCMMNGFSVAQCPKTCRPKTCRGGYTVMRTPTSTCQQTYQRPTYTITPQNHCSSYSRAQPIIYGNPVMGTMVQSTPTQCWHVAPQTLLPSVQTYSVVPTIADRSVQSGCGCRVGSVLAQGMPSTSPQGTSILEQERNPFSLAGHVRPGDERPVDHCLQEFLRCCENGHSDCMLNYYNCTQVTGEHVRHSYCPGTPTPGGDDQSKNPK